MNKISPLRFAVASASCVLLLIVLSVFWLPTSFFANTVCGADKLAAKEAISLTKDWAVWMAGIQTATIAALGLLAKDGTPTLNINSFQAKLAVLVALFNTLALFFSAWLLTSLSSLMLRMYQDGLTDYDFYNRPLYAFMEKYNILHSFTVGFVAFWNHWLWAIGVLLFGALSISMIVRRK